VLAGKSTWPSLNTPNAEDWGVVTMPALPKELLSAEAFLDYLGVQWPEAKFLYYRRGSQYRAVTVPKRSGETRTILIPNDRLKHIQREILKLLESVYVPRYPVHGFTKAKSHKTNATQHLQRRYLVNIDIKDFFDSISEKRIVGLFNALGIHPVVATLLGKFCALKGRLPQGAPTSPIISNMICLKLDRAFLRYAKEHRVLYTRYADDISLSTHNNPNAIIKRDAVVSGKLAIDELSDTIVSIVEQNGFELNHKKLWFLNENSRKRVTGLIVNQILNVDRRYVRNIRTVLHKAETIGWAATQREFETRFSGTANIEQVTRSKITYLADIRGRSNQTFRSLASRFNEVATTPSISIAPTPEEMRERAVWVVESILPDGDGDQGTAFHVDGVGFVTAYHCVDSGAAIEIFHPIDPSKRYKAKFITGCKTRDIAILGAEIPDELIGSLEWSGAAPEISDAVQALGYPSHGPGKHVNFRKSEVVSLAKLHAVSLIEVSVSLPDGMSGGPLLDSDFNVLGIIHKGGADSSHNYCVDASHIIEILKEPRRSLVKRRPIAGRALAKEDKSRSSAISLAWVFDRIKRLFSRQ